MDEAEQISIDVKVEQWDVGAVKPYPHNPRKMSDKAVAKVAASLKEFGWQQAIVVDEQGVVIAGHTRLAAAKHLGQAHVPVRVAHGLTEAQAAAYRIADNRVAEETDWDKELLAMEVAALTAMGDAGLELEALGFDEAELERMIQAEVLGDVGEDKEPAAKAPKRQVARDGDVWLLGDHKLIVGPRNLDKADAAIQAWQKKAKAAAILEALGETYDEVVPSD